MDLGGIFKTASATIVGLVEENEKLRRENEEFRIRSRAEKVAHAMHQRGIDTDRTLDELADELVKMAHSGDLDKFEEAVSLVGPDMSAFHGLKENGEDLPKRSLANYILRED
jgi:hypothetical protein